MISGCRAPEASNFDSHATEDDGSCARYSGSFTATTSVASSACIFVGARLPVLARRNPFGCSLASLPTEPEQTLVLTPLYGSTLTANKPLDWTVSTISSFFLFLGNSTLDNIL